MQSSIQRRAAKYVAKERLVEIAVSNGPTLAERASAVHAMAEETCHFHPIYMSHTDPKCSRPDPTSSDKPKR